VVTQVLLQMCIVFVLLVLGVLLFYKNTSLFHLSSTAILLDFVQVCGLFAALSLGWSSQASSYLSSVTFFNFNIDFLAVPCAFGGTRSYFNRFIFIMVFPLAIAAVFALIYVVWAMLARVWPHPEQQAGRYKTSAFAVLRTVNAAGARQRKQNPNALWAQHNTNQTLAVPAASHTGGDQYLVPVTGPPQSADHAGQSLEPLPNTVISDNVGVQYGMYGQELQAHQHTAGNAQLTVPLPTSTHPAAHLTPGQDHVIGVHSSPSEPTVPVAPKVVLDGSDKVLPEAHEAEDGIKTVDDAMAALTMSMKQRSSTMHNGAFMKSVLGSNEHKAWSCFCLSGSCWVPYFDQRKRLDQMVDAYLLFLTLAHIPLSRNCLSYFRCVTTPDRRYLVRDRIGDSLLFTV